jgi:dihydroorotase
MFDLLVKNGRVVDPSQGLDRAADVAVAAGRIAAIDPEIPSDAAYRTLDASGLVVCPGLIDFHTHVFHDFTYWGIEPDSIGARSGVTTWVDAGSAGAITFPGFRRFIADDKTVRVRAFLNIAYIGLIAPDFELRSMEYCDVDLFERIYRRHGDVIVGIKVRMGTPTVGENGVEPLRRARQAAERCGLPIMVHIADAPPGIDEILELLLPGDIITHCFSGATMKLVDDDGHVLAHARRAVEMGVILDLGHGAGGMTFASADAMIAGGLKPDVISSDLHQMSRYGPSVISSDAAESPFIRAWDDGPPGFDLLTCLNKLMALGLTLDEVIRAATASPAALIGCQATVGSLAVGAHADIGIFELEEGRFEFRDVVGDSRTGSRRLVNVATVINGVEMERGLARAPAPWVDLVPRVAAPGSATVKA